MDKKLAKISSAGLNVKDRGILTFNITVNYEDGLSQNIGGITLDDYDKGKETRIGTAYGCEMIRQLLLEVGVNDFSEMKGKHIWVLGDGTGFSFKTLGIRSLNVDNKDAKDLIFDDILKSMSTKEY